MEDTDLFSTAKSRLDQISARFQGKSSKPKPGFRIPTNTAFSPTTEIKEFQIKVSAPEEIEYSNDLKPFDEENTEISVNKEEVDKIISRYSSLREQESSYPVWRSQKNNKPTSQDFYASSILKQGSASKPKGKVKIKEPPLSNTIKINKISRPENQNPSKGDFNQNVNDYFSVPLASNPHHNRSQSYIPLDNSNINPQSSKQNLKKIIEPKSLFSTPTKSRTKKKIFEKTDFTPQTHDLSKSMTQHKIRKNPVTNVNSQRKFISDSKLDTLILRRGGKIFENSDISIFYKFLSSGKFRIFIQNKLQWNLNEIYLKIPYFKGLENFTVFPNESSFDIEGFSSKVLNVKSKSYISDVEAVVMVIEYRKDHFTSDYQEINFAIQFSIFHFLEFEPVVYEWFKSFWRINRAKIVDGNFSISSRESFYRLIDFLGFVMIEKVSERKEKFYVLGKLHKQNSCYLLKMILQDHWLTVKALTPDGSFSILKTIIKEIKFLV